MTVNKPIIFGITGPSGSGKGYVSDIFREQGVTVLDADRIGHEVCEPEGAAYRELFEHFGADYFNADGTLNRKKLAALVFSSQEELGILNEITHKHIKNEILKRLEGKRLAAIDGAVIIGSCIEPICKFMVGVIAPQQTREERITERDGIGIEAARARISVQEGEEFYRRHCRYIIENNGESDEVLRFRVREILDEVPI